MISFKQFLESTQITEATVNPWDVKKIEVDKAIDLLNTHCKQGLRAIKNGGMLYRGFGTRGVAAKKHDFQVIDTSNSLRTSRDYDNAYMLLMAAAKHTKDIPNRSNSLICSSSYLTALDYAGDGGVKAVIPFDGAKIAYVNYSDFNEIELNSKLMQVYGLPSRLVDITLFPFFNMILAPTKSLGDGKKKLVNKEFIDHTAIDASMSKYTPLELALFWTLVHDTDKDGLRLSFRAMKKEPNERNKYKSLIKLFFETDTSLIKAGVWKNDSVKRLFSSVIQAIQDKHIELGDTAKGFYKLMQSAPSEKRFSSFADEVINPNAMRLKVVEYGDKLPWNAECWVSGKAILISEKAMAAILRELINRDATSVHSSVRENYEYYLR